MGGTAAVFAVNFTHPIELVKSRVQVNNLGVMQTISDTMKNEGFAAFWKVRLKELELLKFWGGWALYRRSCCSYSRSL